MLLDTLVLEIRQLPLTTRLELVEIIAESVREELTAIPNVSKLPLGMLKPDGDVPSDEVLNQDYINHLDEKWK